jgi:hypothetical protein
MANEEHLEILKQGVEVWNRWREENPDVRPDLSLADLRWADLSEADLRRAILSEADLRRAVFSRADLRRAILSETDLRRADFIEADLRGAILHGADLRVADLSQADLIEADLRGADLSGADLRGADLNRADLRQAILSGVNLRGADLNKAAVGFTIFADLDLSVSRGLEFIYHVAPSTIGIDTIYRSLGKIPEAFLRGAGVPDTFITYIASLACEAIQYYSCFISYSSKDEAFAQSLHADLQENKVRCWFAPEDMKIGDKVRLRIDESIRMYDKLLVVLSEHSINSSWVEDEVETAFEEESKRKKTVLFPIRLDDMVMEAEQAWAAKIRRTRHIGDFSHWKDHDSYHQAFDRLLRDLKASEA